MASESLTLLLSRQAAQSYGARIDEAMGATRYRYLFPDEEPDMDGTWAADIALLSRDVTADSGKTVLAPSLERFYDMLRRSPNLRWLQLHQAGADRPICAEMRARGVAVTTASGANAVPVAQMAIAGMLALTRRIPELLDAQRRRAWEPLLGARAPRDLQGQTAVVVGLGPIGLEIARLLKALRVKVIGVRRSATPSPDVDQAVPLGDLHSVLPKADFLFLACPLTDETRGLLRTETIDLLPPSAHVINVSRGDVIVERDLIAALRNGRIGGAYLDVFVDEPLHAQSALWDFSNVIVTPHTAGHTTGHYAAVGEIFADNLKCWLRGLPLRNAIA